METMFEAFERKKLLLHASEKPWSTYTQVDYSIEQWHRACLIHLHDGAPTSKDQCKLPVRTPGGVVSRPGVHAAAAALAGARGGVNAPDAQKSSAAKALITLYNSLSETPPDSLVQHSELEHFGIKGMKWGVHNGTVREGASRGERKAAKKESRLAYKDWKKEVGGEKVANEIFQEATKTFGPAVKAINNDPAFRGKDLTKDARLRQQYDNTISAVFNQHLAQASIRRTTTNTGRAMIYQFDSSVGMMRATESQLSVHHADGDSYPDFIAEMDEFGHVISLRLAKPGETNTAVQSDKFDISDFLEHYGVKGMKWGVRNRVHESHSEDASRVGQLHGRVGAHKSTKILTNKELKDAIDRMNLEQQYSRLSGGHDLTRRKKISRWVADTVLGIAKDTVKEVGKNEASLQVKDAMDQKMKRGKYTPKVTEDV